VVTILWIIASLILYFLLCVFIGTCIATGSGETSEPIVDVD